MPFFHELPSFSVHIIIMLKWLVLVNDQGNILTLNEIIVHIEKNLRVKFFLIGSIINKLMRQP